MADFGLSEDMYGSSYYRRSESEAGERVPIRWMAPESIEMYFYDESTDVVRHDVQQHGYARDMYQNVHTQDMILRWSQLIPKNWC